MKLTTIADDVAELATRIANALPERLHAMREAMSGQPGGQSFDVVRSSRGVMWCWEHEREVSRCHQEDEQCDGETIVVNDPTGEAGVRAASGEDRASRNRKELEKQIRAAYRALDFASLILAAYAPTKMNSDRAGIGTCHDCNVYFDGQQNKRITAYRDTGAMVCTACRSRRDRKSA